MLPPKIQSLVEIRVKLHHALYSPLTEILGTHRFMESFNWEILELGTKSYNLEEINIDIQNEAPC